MIRSVVGKTVLWDSSDNQCKHSLHHSGSFDTPEWKTCISQPSLPYVLKMLAGLSHWHTKTQEALMEVIHELHLLEQVASEQHIGTLAENLLEVMAEHQPCYEEVGSMVLHD